MGYGDPMPTRSRARRNPDPTQTLREYLRERDEAIAQGAFVAAGIDIEAHEGYLSFPLWDWIGYAHVFVFGNYPFVEIDAKSYHGRVDLTSIAVALAERTGRIVVLALGRPPKTYDEMIAQGFTFAETWYGDKFVYVPKHFEDRGAVGLTFTKKRPRQDSMRRPYKEYLLNDVGILRVPRKYRAQVRRLVLDALAHDDLNLYTQARELASLVSE
jgi:hypothetical protein